MLFPLPTMRSPVDPPSPPDLRGEVPGGPKSKEIARKRGNSAQDSADSAQPSTPNGVPDGMASLAIDNPGLGAGFGSGSHSGVVAEAGPVRNSAGHSGIAVGLAGAGEGERTDADVMLAVAAGDEAGF